MSDNSKDVVSMFAYKLNQALDSLVMHAPHLDDTVDLVDREALNRLLRELRIELHDSWLNSGDGLVSVICGSLHLALHLALLTRHPRDIEVAKALLVNARQNPDWSDSLEALADQIAALEAL